MSDENCEVCGFPHGSFVDCENLASREVASGANPQSGFASLAGCRDARASKTAANVSASVVETKSDSAASSFRNPSAFLKEALEIYITPQAIVEFIEGKKSFVAKPIIENPPWPNRLEAADAAPCGQRASLDNVDLSHAADKT